MTATSEDYGKFTALLPSGARGAAPPPYPYPDPRTPDCTHEWSGAWGKVGERQRRCLHCDRFVWEHDLPDDAKYGA